jgi:hypothetical protein
VCFQDEIPQKGLDPFYESQENHNLIGVATVVLEVLFHDVRLDYHTPIISQQGEVAGRLQVRNVCCASVTILISRKESTLGRGKSFSLHHGIQAVSGTLPAMYTMNSGFI